MKWAPRVVFGATTLDLTVSQRPWVPGSVAIGGSEVSAAGVPESFTIRRDHFLEVRLRFTEAQFHAAGGVHDWLIWAQDNVGVFTWYPDRNALDTYSCYLESPKTGEEIRPERSEYPGHFELTVRLRTSNGVRFAIGYY